MTTLQQFLEPISDHALVCVVIACGGSFFCHTQKAIHVKADLENFMNKQVYNAFVHEETIIVNLTQIVHDEEE